MAFIFCSSCLQIPSSRFSYPCSQLSSQFLDRSCWSCLFGWKGKGRKRRPRLRQQREGAAVIAQLVLQPPPYPLDALEPHMSRETVEYHWGRHHKDHVDSVNRLIAGMGMDDMGLEDIVLTSYNRGNPLPHFVHAAQIWNHDFFWQSMKPSGGGRPTGKLMELIDRDFGSFDRMLQELTRAAATLFGSGWVWLAYKANRLDVGNAANPCPSENDNKLVIHKTPNAVNPLVWDYSPLLVIDVWEHAYYLDFENRKTDYVRIFIEKLVSWEAVNSRLESALARAEERRREDERRRQEDEVENMSSSSEAAEMYLDSENDESETESE